MDSVPVVLQDLSPASVAAILGLALPALVALLTKYDVVAKVRIWVNMALSALAGAASLIVASDGSYGWTAWLLSSLAAFLTSIIAYVGVYKPTGAAASVAAKTENFGVGTPQSKPVVTEVDGNEVASPERATIEDLTPDEGENQDGS